MASNDARTNETVASLVDRLIARADNAYCEYIGQSREDECLGWEIKVEKRLFGWNELAAHTRRGELLGRHRALLEAAELLSALRESPDGP